MQSTHQETIHSVSPILDLPTCILADILSRLPVNSIYDCIYVCKAWYDLLSDPYFSTVYRKRPPYISLLLSLRSSNGGSFPWYFQSVELKWDYDSDNPHRIEMPKFLKTPKIPPRNVELLGCCNGLLCLSHFSHRHKKQYDFYICNPMLGEFVKLPQPNMESEDYYTQEFGFGCHPTTGQYKVLRIVAKKVKGGDELKSEAEVFTLGVDHTWRSVGDAPLPLEGSFCKIPLHGALHWLVEYDNENPDFIYSFDIKEEKLGYSELVMWWMRKYGVVESWTKQIICIGYNTYEPIATWRDGEILMYTRNRDTLLSYNPKKKNKNGDDDIDVCGGRPLKSVTPFGGRLMSVTPFVASCVSLKNIMMDGDLEVVKLNRDGRRPKRRR